MTQSERRDFFCAQGNGAVNASADKEGAKEDDRSESRSHSSLHLPSSKGKEADGEDSCGRHGVLNVKEVSGVTVVQDS